MSTPAENPAITARRAVDLWAACERELREMAVLVRQRDGEQKKIQRVVKSEQEFLSHFMPGEDNPWFDLFKPGETVPINAFLEACLPPKSKSERRVEKWHAFLARKLRKNGDLFGLPGLTESASVSAAPLLAERLAKTGIPADEKTLPKVRDDFLDFVREHDEAIQNARTIKSIRMKQLLGPSRKLREKKFLTDKEKDALKSITDEEISRIVEKLDINPKEASTWKAALDDLKAPKSARPKPMRKAPPGR